MCEKMPKNMQKMCSKLNLADELFSVLIVLQLYMDTLNTELVHWYLFILLYKHSVVRFYNSFK